MYSRLFVISFVRRTNNREPPVGDDSPTENPGYVLPGPRHTIVFVDIYAPIRLARRARANEDLLPTTNQLDVRCM